MELPTISRISHTFTVELSRELYDALLERVRNTGLTEAELLTRGLQQFLTSDVERSPHQLELLSLEKSLENTLELKLKLYVEKCIESLMADRSTSDKSDAALKAIESNVLEPSASEPPIKSALPIPTIRPLQSGDRVLVLEPDCPYYMAKLVIIRTSLIRATVMTDNGEKTFLKRDLRFVEAAAES